MNFFFTAVGFFEAGLLLDTLPLDESSSSCGGPSFLGAAFFTTFRVISSSELDTSKLPPKPPALESFSETSLSAPDPRYSSFSIDCSSCSSSPESSAYFLLCLLPILDSLDLGGTASGLSTSAASSSESTSLQGFLFGFLSTGLKFSLVCLVLAPPDSLRCFLALALSPELILCLAFCLSSAISSNSSLSTLLVNW